MSFKLSRPSIVIIAVAFALALYGYLSSNQDDATPQAAAVIHKPSSESSIDHPSTASTNQAQSASNLQASIEGGNLSARIDQLQARTNQAQQIHDVFAVSVPPVAPLPPAAPPQKPSAPPFPYTIIGAMQDGDVRTLYLSRSDRVVIARSGQDLDGLYHVDSIAGQALTVTYLPLHQQQTVGLGRAR